MSAIIPPVPIMTAQTVLGTAELVEHILVSADIRTIINCQHVNRFLRAVAQNSNPVKRAMWLLPDPMLQPSAPDKVIINPLLLEHAEESDWQRKCQYMRAPYSKDFLMNLIWTEKSSRGTSWTKVPYRPASTDSRAEKLKLRADQKAEMEQDIEAMEVAQETGATTAPGILAYLKGKVPNDRPIEVEIKDIDIVTNRVRFLRKLLEGDGIWKGMILFQPNPFVTKDATFGYWVYQETSNLDVLRCNGGKWPGA